jgi:hypothetical protein
MPLQKIVFKPGVNRENTRYTTEGGWYEADKVRFRQGTPEKIGGWVRISSAIFLGICRSIKNWTTLGFQNLLGIGTHLKFYISNGGQYYDITPTTPVHTLIGPFATVSGSATVTVTDATGGYSDGDFVTFTGATAVGGLTISGEFKLSFSSGTTYTITAASAASSTASGGGTVYAVYQVSVGPETVAAIVGWGAGAWGAGTWGIGATSSEALRIWNQANFGEDLIYGPRGAPLYYWDATIGYIAPTITLTIATPCVVSTTLNLPDLTAIVLETSGALPTGLSVGVTYYTRYVSATTFNLSTTPAGALINTTGSQSGVHKISQRGVLLSSLNGATGVPTAQNYFLISDASRFVLCFGTNEIGSSTVSPMLVRWSDQENPVDWTPSATNQAGSITLSRGSEIITAIQTRQEILIYTNIALYSFQYLGPPFVWGSQILSDNISIISPNAVATASGIVFWMGVDKFYMYDGSVKTMRCDLRQFVFSDLNMAQSDQIFAVTNEGFNEVWWFYCSAGSMAVDQYVVYNYLEDIWYYGTMARTAGLDSGIGQFPIAATYSNNIVEHENGLNDQETATATAINAYITSSQFDIGDGHNFAFVYRMLPDLTFRGSTSNSPVATMYLFGLKNSGSGYNNPASVGGSNNANITGTAMIPVEEFTGQVYTRIRGRQMAVKIESDQLNMTWQLGSPRIDIRQDGRR